MSEVTHIKPADVVQSVGLTRQSIKDFATSIIEEVEQGRINPLDLKLYIKALETAITFIQKGDQVTEGIDSYAREEAEKHGQKCFDFKGVKVELAETGTKYQFDNCGDTVWEFLNKEMEALKKRITERETFLKSIKGEETIADRYTGEMITVHPPVKTSTSSIKVTFK
jgi:hypothetical protein